MNLKLTPRQTLGTWNLADDTTFNCRKLPFRSRMYRTIRVLNDLPTLNRLVVD
jgi:hypothetical protein